MVSPFVSSTGIGDLIVAGIGDPGYTAF